MCPTVCLKITRTSVSHKDNLIRYNQECKFFGTTLRLAYVVNYDIPVTGCQ